MSGTVIAGVPGGGVGWEGAWDGGGFCPACGGNEMSGKALRLL